MMVVGHVDGKRIAMVQRIGLIGAGMINTQIARLSTKVGIDVLLSNTRGPDTLKSLVAELGSHAHAGTIEEAAAYADIVSVSVPFSAYDKLPTEALIGKIVIDTMNYYPGRDGVFPQLDNRELTSSELLQRHLSGSRVVKALYNLDAFHLLNGARPGDTTDRWAMPVTSDDDDAKARVIEFLDQIGYEGVDVGTLADSWRVEADTPIYVNAYVGQMPEGLTLEEQIEWYAHDNAGTVTRDDVLRLAAQADKNATVGGHPESLHPAWTTYVGRYTQAANAAK